MGHNDLLRTARPNPRRARLALGVAAVTAVALAVVPGAAANATPTAKAKPTPQQRAYPANLPRSLSHPGRAIVAFRTPVRVVGKRFAYAKAASNSATDINALNTTLGSLKATSVSRLFVNLPQARLAAARSRAERSTGQYVTDFSQVYEINYNPAVNAGVAANRLAKSKLVSAAMPDWKFAVPSDSVSLNAAQAKAALAAVRQARTRARSAQKRSVTSTSLPTNSAYTQDAQSYQDAASDDVTGAAAMIAKRFGQQPGQGEVVTNISLGTVDNTSTVLDHGQRYIEEAGMPKIPVWLANQTCTGTDTSTCSIDLDPTATNTSDGQGDFIEVNLDFSVMAPPPVGDPRIVNPAPAGLGQILGSAYGASYRLINPLQNGSQDFLASFLGAGFLQSPAPAAITASIGDGFAVGGFSDYFFEDEAIIHDVVTTLVQGADIFVSISAGDGQSDTAVAMNPNGLTEPTEVTTDPAQVTDIDDPANYANPNYSYGVTNQPQYVIDSGSNDAGANTLNDVYNNAPWNTGQSQAARHSQHTTETRWTGQQNFHTGSGSRVTISAPGDDVVFLAQVEVNGVPVNPVATFPRLVGGSSASAPQVAAGAAVVRQAARLLGIHLDAVGVRTLLEDTGRANVVPSFDLSKANIGPALDVTAAVQALFRAAHVSGTPSFVRMTVAQRKAVLTYTDFRSSFWSDTTQNAAAHTATIDLSQGLVAPSSRTNETVGSTGDNVFAPITFAADAAYMPAHPRYRWTLALNGHRVRVPRSSFDPRVPSLRLLPSEIFGLLGAPVTARSSRVVTVTVKGGGATTSTRVTFLGQANATHAHAVPPSFKPVLVKGGRVTFRYDLRGLRDGSGGVADGGELIVSDIDRAVPQAFPDNDVNVHGFKRTLTGVVGSITLPSSAFPHGVGTYGVALRGTKGGREIPDSTSFFLPLRFAPRHYQVPATPKVQAVASILNGAAPLYYDVMDIENGGSQQFAVAYDVRNVTGAKGAIVEFSAPTYNFASAFLFTGDFGPTNSFVNNFTNPIGDRLDAGDNFGQPGETAHVAVAGTHGLAQLNAATLGLTIPSADCDSSYQVRVFATNARGHIIAVSSDGSILSVADLSKAVCAA